ncbi:MAG: choice-of-anchor tandem repeat GloVer-containing protein [Candidatus Sulfotelmatobacter sp.]
MPYKQYLQVAIASFVFATVSGGLVTRAAAATNFTVIHTFEPSQGIDPNPGLIRDSAGNLYGTTQEGCPEKCGAVYELSPTSGWTETTLYTFHCGGRSGVVCPDGGAPMFGVTLDSKGNLYGTTVEGGANSHGTVFRLSPNGEDTWAETVIYSFCALGNCADGGGPSSGVIFDQQGNLYGVAGGGALGHGVVYELSAASDGKWTETVLYNFTGEADGGMPEGNLVVDSSGNLYGTTFLGGGQYNNYGIAFELSKASGAWVETVIHTFGSSNKDGTSPSAGMIFGPDGSLYGTTSYGGKVNEGHGIGYGVVFQLIPSTDGWNETILLDFNGGAEGGQPYTGLSVDSSGNLYGTTSSGGARFGVAYELQPQSNGDWNEIVLHAFENSYDGAYPTSLIPGPAGKLYGTATGGATANGVVFESGEE